MDNPKTKGREEICHRCLQPVPRNASRCPGCGEPAPKSGSIRMVLGVLGLLMFLGIALMAFRLLHIAGPRPASDDAPQIGDQPATPPPPEKKPALGQ